MRSAGARGLLDYLSHVENERCAALAGEQEMPVELVKLT